MRLSSRIARLYRSTAAAIAESTVTAFLLAWCAALARWYPSDAVSDVLTGALEAAVQALVATGSGAAVLLAGAMDPTGSTRTVRTASEPATSLVARTIRDVIRRS